MMTLAKRKYSMDDAVLMEIMVEAVSYTHLDVYKRQVLGLVYGPSGMALVFLVAAGFAMPVVLLFRRLFRDKQPIAIPFLPFLACGCSVATLAEIFL